MKTVLISVEQVFVLVLIMNIAGFAQTWNIGATDKDRVTATLGSDGTLTIRGIGKMKNLSYYGAFEEGDVGSNIGLIGEFGDIDRRPWRKNTNAIAKVVIENGVTSIGSGAFKNCERLTSVTIPSSVITIEGNAFGGCTALTSVAIPNGVTSIESGAFYGCSNLKSITIPKNVTSIGNGIFGECNNLTSITSLNLTPPKIHRFEDESGCGDEYGETDNSPLVTTTTTCVLYVPKGREAVYRSADGWGKFNRIVPIDLEGKNPQAAPQQVTKQQTEPPPPPPPPLPVPSQSERFAEAPRALASFESAYLAAIAVYGINYNIGENDITFKPFDGEWFQYTFITNATGKIVGCKATALSDIGGFTKGNFIKTVISDSKSSNFTRCISGDANIQSAVNVLYPQFFSGWGITLCGSEQVVVNNKPAVKSNAQVAKSDGRFTGGFWVSKGNAYNWYFVSSGGFSEGIGCRSGASGVYEVSGTTLIMEISRYRTIKYVFKFSNDGKTLVVTNEKNEVDTLNFSKYHPCY